jgi:hypothetical protein
MVQMYLALGSVYMGVSLLSIKAHAQSACEALVENGVPHSFLGCDIQSHAAAI